MAAKVLQYLSVRIGKQWYGIDVDRVVEVLHLISFTEAAALRDDILGLITVRDEVMPLLDLRRRFGINAELKLDTPLVAIRGANGSFGLLVDDADRVEEINESQITASQDSQQFPYVRAIAKQPGRLLLLLDTDGIA